MVDAGRTDRKGGDVGSQSRSKGGPEQKVSKGKREIQEHLGGSKPGTSWLREEELPGQEKRNFLAEQKQEEAEEN